MNHSNEENKNTQDTVRSSKNKQETRELIRFILIAALIIVPFRIFVAQPFIVNGASMDPTFETNQYLIVDQISYQRNEPSRGDVVIFRYPLNPKDFYIKRIIGLPGETVTIRGNEVFIQEVDSATSYKLEEPYITFQDTSNIQLRTILDEKEYFVMGDNRPNSSDSRVWGVLPEEFIKGKAFLRLLPLNKIQYLPGDFDSRLSSQTLTN